MSRAVEPWFAALRRDVEEGGPSIPDDALLALLDIAEAAQAFVEINRQKSTNLMSEWNDAAAELHAAVSRAAHSQEKTQ